AGFRRPTPLGMAKVGHRLKAARAAHGDRELALAAEATAALERLCEELAVSIHTVLQAAWALLLSRYGGVEDVAFGCLKSNRAAVPEGDRIIGPLINTLAMRVRVPGELRFDALLQQVREQWTAHRPYEFTPLSRVRQWSEIAAEARLFDSVVVFENFRWSEALRAKGGPWAERRMRVCRQPEYPLTLYGFKGRRLGAMLIYDRRAFDATTIVRMLGHLEQVLLAAAAAPGRRLAAFELLTAAERTQVLHEWNDTAVTWDLERTLGARIAEQAVRAPEAVAVVGEGVAWSYGHLLDRSLRLAGALGALGVTAEARVGIACRRSPELMAGLLGILFAGAAYVPLDPDYPPARLAFMLADSGLRVLLTERHLLAALPASGASTLCLDAGEPWERLPPAGVAVSHPDGPAYVIYTSGSTGLPKGVVNTHRGIVNRLLWMQAAFPLTRADGVLQKTSISFDVSAWELFWPLLVGARLVLARPGGHRDAAYLVSRVAATGVTTLHFVPSMLPAFLDAPGLADCGALRRVFASGEALSGELARRFGNRLGRAAVELHNLYGPTEAAVDVTGWPAGAETGARPVPIGRPVANTRIHLLDPYGHEVPPGVAGELCIGGVQLARGYWGRPELTAERFVPDPTEGAAGGRVYRTGDLARRLADGAVEFLGRLDHQVKLRGFRVELGEVEAALSACLGVAAAVAGIRGTGEAACLVAWVVPAPGAELDAAGLREALRRRLPEPMVPALFSFLPTLPLTANGKVDRRALLAAEGAEALARAPYAPPRTGVEELLVEIWQELLGVERVGIDDPFFDLGGHSLLASQLVARVCDRFAVEVPLPALFESRTTVATLAQTIDRQRVGASGPEPG
ncbi:MAG TPA: amino acid adenylation domain-containing protein, partial [Thermoanaerobaculia bacterium]|nr:amino acid adenylation domain-containing protein [Thermoanaerobaculia bacterium]